MVEKNSYYIKKKLPLNGQIKAKQDKAVFQSFLIPNQSVFNEAFCFTIMFYNTRLSFDQTRPVVDHFRLTDPRAQVQIFSVGLFYYRAQGPTLLSYSLLFMV